MSITLRSLPYALENCDKWQKSEVKEDKYTHHLDLGNHLKDYQPTKVLGDVVWIFGANCSGKTSLAKRFLPDVEPTFQYAESDVKQKKPIISKYGDVYGLGGYLPDKKISGLDTLMSIDDRYKATELAWLDPNCKTVVAEGILNQYMTAHVYYRMMQCIQPRRIFHVYLDCSLDTLEERLFNRSQRRFSDIKENGQTIKDKYYTLARYWMAGQKFYNDPSFDNSYNRSQEDLQSLRHFYDVDTTNSTTEEIYQFIKSEMEKYRD